MRRGIFAVSVMTLALSAGCSVNGKWSLATVEPTAARRDFPYEVLTLQRDGSFYAEAREPHTTTTSGTYRYQDGVLTLQEQDGELNTFTAKMVSADELRLERPWKDRVLVARLERE